MTFGENKPWLRNYAPGVRPHLDYPDIPLYQFLDDAVANYPDLPATVFSGSTLTYRELGNRVDRMARALVDMGVQKGDRVSIMLPNCPQLVIAYYGTLKAGGTVVQSNPMYMERELEYQLNNSGANTIILLENYYSRLQSIKKKTPVKNVVLVKLTGNNGELCEGAQSFDSLLAGSEPLPPSLQTDPKNDVALLQYTGGTTGVSKGASLTHYNLVANTLQTREALAAGSSLEREKLLIALPLFHVFGMSAGMNLAISLAGTQIILPRFDIKALIQAIHIYRPTIFPGVPSMYVAITRYPGLKEYDLTSIKACISGSAPLPSEVAERFELLTGGNLVEGYGLTEAASMVTVNPLNGIRKHGSIGLPVSDTECRIVNLDTGDKVLPPGEIGELVVRGPQVMKFYWERPEETAYALRNGWLYTGDVAKMDRDGYFFIVGRKKDMIISEGFNVYPRDVEEVLYEHPKILETVVLGVNDMYKIESVKAFIVLKEGETATAEEILVFCRERLAAYKVPQVIEFRESLPKTIVGKILRRVLAEEERNKS